MIYWEHKLKKVFTSEMEKIRILFFFKENPLSWLSRAVQSPLTFSPLPLFHSSGEGEDGSHFLTGCLEKIQVQGRDLDLDLAVKHMSISSHSCPA